MLNNFRNNSKEFQKFTLLNGMAMNEMNTQLMMDVNNTVIGKGKDGKQVELVPVVGVGPNGVTQPMYSVPGSNQQFSREQLAQMGITDLMKATDARKEKMDNRRLDMEDRRIGLYGQALSLRGSKGRSPKASDLNAFNRMVDATLMQLGYGKSGGQYMKDGDPVSLDDQDFKNALAWARQQTASSFQQNLGIDFSASLQDESSKDPSTARIQSPYSPDDFRLK